MLDAFIGNEMSELESDRHMTLEEIEELCAAVQEYKTSFESIQAENEILFTHNQALEDQQIAMSDMIDELQRTVIQLDAELTISGI